MQPFSVSDELPRVWGDIVKLYLGGFLSMLPNALGLTGLENVSAHLCGTAVIVLSLAAIYASLAIAEWLALSIGAWLIVSPFVLHFSTAATRLDALFGVLFIVIAAVELRIMRAPQPQQLLAAGSAAQTSTGRAEGLTPASGAFSSAIPH